MRTPRVFPVDEPASDLDAGLRVSMRAEIEHLSHEPAITTVYATRDQTEARTLADRVSVMGQVRIQPPGTPEAIYDDPENLFVAGFIGSPPMNPVQGAARAGDFEVDDIVIAVVPQPDHDGLVLGIRGEGLGSTDPAIGDLDAVVYASELTGESMLVAVEVAGRRIAVQADRRTPKAIGEPVGVALNREHLYLFGSRRGSRFRASQASRSKGAARLAAMANRGEDIMPVTVRTRGGARWS